MTTLEVIRWYAGKYRPRPRVLPWPCPTCGGPIPRRNGRIYCRPECRPGRVPRGRPRDPGDVLLAVRLRSEGWTLRKIAEKFGVTKQCVHQWTAKPKG